MAETSDPPRVVAVAIVGTGRAGKIHAGNFASQVPQAHLVAFADPSEQALADVSKDFAHVEVSTDPIDVVHRSDVDAVVVAAPTAYHETIVVEATRAGKHVLCEKPMAITVGECEAMTAAAESSGVRLQIGFMRRFDPSFVAAKEAIDRGDIGDVVSVRSLTHGPSIPKPWQYDISKSNGPLAEVNSHDIDTLRWLTGSEFRDVHAIAGNFRCPDAKADFPDFYDNVLMLVSFENGMQGVIDGAVSVRYGYDARLEVLGTCGVLTVGELSGDGVTVCTSKDGGTAEISRSWRNLFEAAYLAEDRDFIACIVEGREPRVTGRDGLEAVRAVVAGNRSITEGRPVRLERPT